MTRQLRAIRLTIIHHTNIQTTSSLLTELGIEALAYAQNSPLIHSFITRS